jgi:hypothetical protein
MGEVIDLDALVPKTVVIKFNGQEIEVNPPKLKAYFQLGVYGQRLYNPSILTETEIDDLSKQLDSAIRATIPEIGDAELTGDQAMELANLLVSLGSPQNSPELEKRGLDAKDPKVQQSN